MISCEIDIHQRSEDEKLYIKDSTRILYKLASLDRVRFYIPGKTTTTSKLLKKFAAWGGFIAIYHLKSSSLLPDVKLIFEDIITKEMQLTDLELTFSSLKEQLEINSNNEGFPMYNFYQW